MMKRKKSSSSLKRRSEKRRRSDNLPCKLRVGPRRCHLRLSVQEPTTIAQPSRRKVRSQI